LRLLHAGGLEVFEGGSFRAVLDLENPLPPDHPGVQRFSSAARLRSAVDGGCDGLVAGLPHCYDRRSGAADASMGVDAAVVLAADVTRSIDDGEFVLERR
jgi:hypothetical protein